MTAPTWTPDVGLCAVCYYARVVRSRSGSNFYLCALAAADPSFARYPRLPVLACRGFAPGGEEDDANDGETQ